MSDRKVLMVDDEEQILKSFKRRLRNMFDISVALGGNDALEVILREGPFAVVISDFRMPGMDGVEFLKQVKEISPDTVRIMLTGFADLHTSIKAVNEGQVFRFLTKPCPPEVLAKSIQQAIRFYEFVLAERELLGLQQWRQSLEQLVCALGKLVESRDPYTAGHQQRVAEISRAMAQQMGMDQDAVTSLYLAATVHDVGKVYVPFEFLSKPGTLSDLELDIIRRHPEVGHDILAPVDFKTPLSKMVLQHHERMDGSGYPQGLKGDAILMEARIIAVADVVEAMSSHRPYRPSRGIKKAVNEIEAGAGTRYDPLAVEACLRLFRENKLSIEKLG